MFLYVYNVASSTLHVSNTCSATTRIRSGIIIPISIGFSGRISLQKKLRHRLASHFSSFCCDMCRRRRSSSAAIRCCDKCTCGRIRSRSRNDGTPPDPRICPACPAHCGTAAEMGNASRVMVDKSMCFQSKEPSATDGNPLTLYPNSNGITMSSSACRIITGCRNSAICSSDSNRRPLSYSGRAIM